MRGHLRDASGVPLARTLVSARWTTWLAAGEVRVRDRVTVSLPRETVVGTDADGAFVLCFLPRRTAIAVVAGAPDRPLAQATVRVSRANEEAWLELRAGGR